MADREIIEQIKKLDNTRADRFVEAVARIDGLRFGLADAVDMLVKDYREVAELYTRGRVKGATTMANERRHTANHLALLAANLRKDPGDSYRPVTDANGPSTPMEKCERWFSRELHGPHDWPMMVSNSDGEATAPRWCPGRSERDDRDAEGAKALVAERAGQASAADCDGMAPPPGIALAGAIVSAPWPDEIPGAAEFAAGLPKVTEYLQGVDVQQAQPQSAPPAAGLPALVIDPNGSVHGPDDRNYSYAQWVDAPAPAPEGIVDAPERPGAPPSKGHKLTWRDLRDMADRAARGPETWMESVGLPEHLSHSQMSTLIDCPTKYLAQRSETLGVLERPEWATTGGSAFHAAAEWFERLVLEVKTVQYVRDRLALAGGVEAVWSSALHTEIADVAAANPDFAIDEWRASSKGAEGYTWWLVNGQTMLQRYIDHRLTELQQPWRTPLWINGETEKPALELEYVLDVEGTPVKGIIDQVWIVTGSSDFGFRRGDLLVEDLKAGRTDPDEAQLREYALYLSRVVAPNVRIWGRFYNARKAEWSMPQLLIDEVSHTARNESAWDELAFKVEDANRKKRSGSFAPRKSNYCNGCSVKHACPIFATLTA